MMHYLYVNESEESVSLHLGQDHKWKCQGNPGISYWNVRHWGLRMYCIDSAGVPDSHDAHAFYCSCKLGPSRKGGPF